MNNYSSIIFNTTDYNQSAGIYLQKKYLGK